MTTAIQPTDSTMVENSENAANIDAIQQRFLRPIDEFCALHTSTYVKLREDDAPPRRYFALAERLIVAWGLGYMEISPALMPLSERVEEFARRYMDHRTQHAGYDFTDYDFDSAFFAAREGMENSRNLLRRSLLIESDPKEAAMAIESVEDLVWQKLTDEQIAAIHGLTLSQVRMEREEPGSVCGENYIPPIIVQEVRQSEREILAWKFNGDLVRIAKQLDALAQFPSSPLYRKPK